MKNMHTDVRVYRVNVKREIADKGIGVIEHDVGSMLLLIPMSCPNFPNLLERPTRNFSLLYPS